MKKVVAVAANPPHSIASRNAAWILAGLLTVMVVGQLYSFEKFIPLIQEYALPGGQPIAMLVASLIVISEVMALPFLLRMPLSPLMRWTSLAFGWVAAGIWLGLAFIAIGYAANLDNSGMFGTKVPVPVGIVQIVLSLIIGALTVWSSVGLWPAHKK